jgi:hypothetical protein
MKTGLFHPQIGRRLSLMLLCLTVLLQAAVPALAGGDDILKIEDGMLQPMLQYSDPRASDYSNEDSDILRFCVYVETDHDTDNDGMADLVKALIQVPRAAAEGKYKAAAIYDPTPYQVGTCEEYQDAYAM